MGGSTVQDATATTSGDSSDSLLKDGRFYCPRCPSNYKYKNDLKKHMRLECGVPRRFHCPICPHKSKRGDSTYFLEKGGRFHCLRCNGSYKHKRDLRKHLKLECGVPPKFQCPLCPYKSKRDDSFDSLVKDGRFYCPRCPSSYKYKYDLKKHLKLECGVLRQFQCPLCPHKAKRDDSSDSLVLVKDGRFYCPRCPCNYKNDFDLKKHLKLECGVPHRFPCPLCPYKSKRNSNLKRHCDDSSDSLVKDRRFYCPRCPCNYKYKHDLKKHLKLECGVPRQFPCPLCPYKFTRDDSFDSLVKDGRFYCPRCSGSYKNKSDLKKHLKWECGVPPQFPCPLCPYKTKQRHKCPTCERSYKQRHNLLKHMRFECLQEPRFGCHICPYKGKRKAHLKNHYLFKHSMHSDDFSTFIPIDPDNKKSTCLTCGKSYTYLLEHVRLECDRLQQFSCPLCAHKAKRRKHVCEQCGRGYRQRYNLLVHQRLECNKDPQFAWHWPSLNVKNHDLYMRSLGAVKRGDGLYGVEDQKKNSEDKWFICSGCGRRYKHNRNLQAHVRYECGKEPQFSCPICPYKAKLRVVATLLTEDGRFSCFMCGKSYSQKRNMLAHVRLECGKEAQFQCSACPYKAKRKAHLKNHMAMKHYDLRSYTLEHNLKAHLRYECGKEANFLCPECPYKARRKHHLQNHMAVIHKLYKSPKPKDQMARLPARTADDNIDTSETSLLISKWTVEKKLPFPVNYAPSKPRGGTN
ncbi:zinc finger protein 425-like [Macrosteles quadrilineatus]|uniref:zinc finger protein 425-like n=1 Tax=Macrosteles quadrilineatus TaxID=74068 RepID=UPI0023E127A6|nr:zinc finger protein 425-like [Macrosteles quadrilineatus]